MQNAFLIIVSLLGMGYCVWTKQIKMSAGFLLLTISFILTIPDIVEGYWVNILLALSLMVFTIGVFMIVWKKKEKVEAMSAEEESKTDENKS